MFGGQFSMEDIENGLWNYGDRDSWDYEDIESFVAILLVPFLAAEKTGIMVHD